MLGFVKRKLRQHSELYFAIRRFLMATYRWRKRLRGVHSTAYIGRNCDIQRDLVMEPYSFVNIECIIGPDVSIGAYTMLGPRVAIVGGDHNFDQPATPIIFSGRGDRKTTTIGKDVWVGYGAIILAGCSIEDGAVIASGAVVTKNVSAFEIVGGVPAKKIGVRFSDEMERLSHQDMLNSAPKNIGEYCGLQSDE